MGFFGKYKNIFVFRFVILNQPRWWMVVSSTPFFSPSGITLCLIDRSLQPHSTNLQIYIKMMVIYRPGECPLDALRCSQVMVLYGTHSTNPTCKMQEYCRVYYTLIVSLLGTHENDGVIAWPVSRQMVATYETPCATYMGTIRIWFNKSTMVRTLLRKAYEVYMNCFLSSGFTIFYTFVLVSFKQITFHV